jgi:succinate dehydrogenase/fumarate reductase flavoprotein subunit
VVERATDIGGSAALSGGMVWTMDTIQDFACADPGGTRALQQVVIDEYPGVIDWLESQVPVGPRVPLFGLGHGRQVEMGPYLRHCRHLVEQRGGRIIVRADVRRLVQSDARVRGADVVASGSHLHIRAPWTVLATGGFAHDQELVATRIDERLATMPVRAGREARGGGLKLVLQAGGSYSSENRGFYGHLVSHGAAMRDVTRFKDFTLLHSAFGVLFDETGRRFTDESRSDHINAQATLKTRSGLALLLWDEKVQQDVVLVEYPKGIHGVNKLAVACDDGGAGTTSNDLADIATFATEHGFDGQSLLDELRSYNDAIESGEQPVGPARAENRIACTHPPYYAMVVTPSLTFPFGGIRVDDRARVLRTGSDAPIGGLLAAGVDIGDVYAENYGGGHSLAGAFALRALRTAGLIPSDRSARPWREQRPAS